MATIPDRGRGGGNYRGRGRGRGNFGGPNPDERLWGFGRGAGRGQADRGGLGGAKGQGESRGGGALGQGNRSDQGGRVGHREGVQVMGRISDDEKRQIREAARPTTIQISNEGTDDIIVASPANEFVRHFAQIVLTKPEFTDFQSLGQIRRFVNSCLLSFSNHHSVDTSDLLSALASWQGQERLKDILRMPIDIDAANIYGKLSFQFVVLPLVGVLTRESICQFGMDGATNAIYATVYAHRQNFIKDGIIPNMKRLLERGSLKDQSPGATQIQWEDKYLCVVPSLAIVRLIYQIVFRIRDARTDLARTVRTLVIQVHTCAKNFNKTEWDRRVNAVMVQEVKRLQRIVSDAEDNNVSLLDVTAADPGARSDSAHSKTQLRHSFDPPGKRSANGPSHDNDHVEIAEINIIPTEQEITCSRPPFLPSNGVPDAPHFLAHGWKRQVDTHFRLYREDMMDPFRRSMISFVAVLQHPPFEEEARLLDIKELRKVIAGHVSLNVYGNVQVLGMTTEKNIDGNIGIEFSQPPEILRIANKSQRTDFWERSKNRLIHGGLICLVGRDQSALGSGQNAFTPITQLVPAVITRRETESLAKNDKVAQISVTLADPLQYLLLLSSGKRWFIVESPGTDFGSYRPILKALQHTIPASLPFGKYLAPTAEEQAKIKNIKSFVDPPIYARAPTFHFNLSVLLNGRKWRLDVSNTISIEKTISTLQKDSTLDDSQAKALVETLCREVALIHAPPGTGGTLIGLSLVEVLRANKARSECGPILYICSTNDVLDRFLEQCLDKGVFDIVSVGSGSNSKRLGQYNLEALLGDFTRPYQVEQDLKEVTESLDSDAKKIGSLERTLKGDCMQWNHVQSYLEQDYPKLYKQFGKATNDAHQSSDDKVNHEDAKRSFDDWRSGLDIQEKTAHDEEAKNMLKNNATDPESSPPDYQKTPSTTRSVGLLLDGDIWNMSMNERKNLLDQWRSKVQGILMAQLGEAIKHVETLNVKKKGAMDEIRRRILRQCSVVGMTTTGAAESQELIRKLAPKIIIYEGAGQVLESHILCTLAPSVQHLILIGDHKQLRPRIETYNLSSDSPIGKKYNLDMSLFERLTTSATTPLPMSVLTTQSRMRPCIADLIRQPLYPNLEYGENTHSYPPVCGMGENLYFMNHDHPEDTKEMNGIQSYSNNSEVSMAKVLTKYLTKNGYDQAGDIVILTPYLGQLSKLREALRSKYVLVISGSDQEQLDQAELEEGDENQESVHVQGGPAIKVNNDSTQTQLTLGTVGNWKGEEAKIVIVSLVRNKEYNDSSTSGRIGFLKSPNLTNVLLSRAQHGMCIIGNADLMERETSGIWPSVIKELRDHNRIGSGLPLVCHLEDIEHRLIKCYRLCDRLLPDCLHACQRQCRQSCGDCLELVGSIELACGHTFEKPTCHQTRNPSMIFCKAKVARKSPTCEHHCPVATDASTLALPARKVPITASAKRNATTISSAVTGATRLVTQIQTVLHANGAV
ncbi:hypothetical protein BGZ92_006112 [Podila epicladia]|nr:hypothetical protein BGZ92_006112 [Podila epicladia]